MNQRSEEPSRKSVGSQHPIHRTRARWVTSGVTVRTIATTLDSTHSPLPPLLLTPQQSASRLDAILALLWGITLTLCVTGYTFGQSNHHVYLLDALHWQHPENLQRDWFTTHTLQYHVLYTGLVVVLQKLGLLKAGFFLLYLLLAVGLHGAWWTIVRRIGGDLRAYLISVMIYHVSGGGLGLGVYQFLQDGSFLPSNISAVAALIALAAFLSRRLLVAGAFAGIAGLFHLNYSLMVIACWGLFSLLSLWRDQREPAKWRYVLATVIAVTPCVFNIAVAAKSALTQTDKIPIDPFVQLYVKLRHPHHYDAMSWPLVLWISFLWPIPIALIALRRLPRSVASARLADTFYTSLGVQLFAITFAGIWFLSETIVQLSLFRFSIFAKLISCILAGWLISQASGRVLKTIAAMIAVVGIGLLIAIALRGQIPSSIPPPSVGLLLGAGATSLLIALMLFAGNTWKAIRWAALLALPATIFFAATQRLGIAMPGEAEESMMVLSRWARDNTPVDSLFLVPPHDSAFRLEAQRSSVIGFKHVPQLSGELVEWKRRLDRVLDCDILTLPTPMNRTLDAMAQRYASLSPEHLAAVASEFECDYVVSLRKIDAWNDRLVYTTPDEHYWLYRLHEPGSRS